MASEAEMVIRLVEDAESANASPNDLPPGQPVDSPTVDSPRPGGSPSGTSSGSKSEFSDVVDSIEEFTRRMEVAISGIRGSDNASPSVAPPPSPGGGAPANTSGTVDLANQLLLVRSIQLEDLLADNNRLLDQIRDAVSDSSRPGRPNQPSDVGGVSLGENAPRSQDAQASEVSRPGIVRETIQQIVERISESRPGQAAGRVLESVRGSGVGQMIGRVAARARNIMSQAGTAVRNSRTGQAVARTVTEIRQSRAGQAAGRAVASLRRSRAGQAVGRVATRIRDSRAGQAVGRAVGSLATRGTMAAGTVAAGSTTGAAAAATGATVTTAGAGAGTAAVGGAGVAGAATIGAVAIPVAAVAAGFVALAAAAMALKNVFESTADGIEEYSAAISMERDIRRANTELNMVDRAERIGPQLGKFEAARSRYQDATERLWTQILEILVKFEPLLTKGVDAITVGVDTVSVASATVDQIFAWFTVDQQDDKDAAEARRKSEESLARAIDRLWNPDEADLNGPTIDQNFRDFLRMRP